MFILSKTLKIAAVQAISYWEDVKKNLTHYKTLIEEVDSSVDLIVLPEMFLTGFTNNAKACAVEMEGSEIKEVSNWAVNHHKAIVGSVIVLENGRYYNRMMWFMPDATIQHYDKKHLFTYANEDKVYTPGRKRLIVNFKGFKIACFICYDLRFPVWMRNRIVDNEVEYDLAIVTANWPKVRIEAWEYLLKGRAVENQAYILGVNRVGVDGNQIIYNGKTMLVESNGSFIQSADDKEEVSVFNLELKSLNDFRSRFPFLNDDDNFTITV